MLRHKKGRNKFGLLSVSLSFSADAAKNDKRDGIVKTYYKSGKLLCEAPYKNDKREGITRGYYESGKLEAEILWKNGKREGVGRTFYESGRLKAEIPFKGDKAQEIGKIYSEKGTLERETPFKDGKLKGVPIDYDDNGREIEWLAFISNTEQSIRIFNDRKFFTTKLVLLDGKVYQEYRCIEIKRPEIVYVDQETGRQVTDGKTFNALLEAFTLRPTIIDGEIVFFD